MTLSKSDTICDAVATALSAGPLVALLPATRKHAFAKKLEDVARDGDANADKPIVSVYTKAWRTIRTSRSTYYYMIDVGVCTQCYCQFSDTAKQDSLVLLLETILEFMQGMPSIAGAKLMDSATDPIFDPEHLSATNQFHSDLIFSFRLERSLS